MIYDLFLLLNCWFGLLDDWHNMVWVGISVVVGNSIGVNGVGDNSFDGLDHAPLSWALKFSILFWNSAAANVRVHALALAVHVG